MPKFIINGGHKLSGEIVVKGAKNAALKIIPAALLSEDTITIHNLPKIEDIKKCIDEGKVYLNDALTISIAGKNNFSFYNGTEIIKLFVCASNH